MCGNMWFFLFFLCVLELERRVINMQWHFYLRCYVKEDHVQVFYKFFPWPTLSDNRATLFVKYGSLSAHTCEDQCAFICLICGCSNIGCQADSHTVGNSRRLSYVIMHAERHALFSVNRRVTQVHVTGVAKCFLSQLNFMGLWPHAGPYRACLVQHQGFHVSSLNGDNVYYYY